MADFPETLNGDAYLVGDGLTSQIFVGNAITQKISFYGKDPPVAQPAAANQGDPGIMTTAGDNTGTSNPGLTLIGDTTAVNQALNLMNDLLALCEDINRIDLLLTEIRTCLVNVGMMKGSA